MGIDIYNHFRCYEGAIELINNGLIDRSIPVNSCELLSFIVRFNKSELRIDVSSLDGNYVLIDFDKVNDKLKYFSKNKPIVIE